MNYLKFVPKRWGYEKWIVNNDKYCGKILFIAAGKSFSYHYHIQKSEHFHFLEGYGKVYLVDDVRKENYITFEQMMDNLENLGGEFAYWENWQYIGPNETFEIKPYCGHKVEAQTDLTIVEFSTHHEDADSYRLETISEEQ